MDNCFSPLKVNFIAEEICIFVNISHACQCQSHWHCHQRQSPTLSPVSIPKRPCGTVTRVSFQQPKWHCHQCQSLRLEPQWHCHNHQKTQCHCHPCQSPSIKLSVPEPKSLSLTVAFWVCAGAAVSICNKSTHECRHSLELCTAAEAIMHLLPKQTDEHNSLSVLYQLLQPRPDTNAPTALLYDHIKNK